MVIVTIVRRLNQRTGTWGALPSCFRATLVPQIGFFKRWFNVMQLEWIPSGKLTVRPWQSSGLED